MRAEKAIAVHWQARTTGQRRVVCYLKKNAAASRNARPVGSIADGMAAADKKLSQTYTVAYIAHAPLEPRAAVAEWNDGKLTVWTGTQRPFGVRSELAEAFHIPEEKVRVIVPDTGSDTAASTRANARSKRRDSRVRVASRSNSFGRAKRNSTGPTFVPRA